MHAQMLHMHCVLQICPHMIHCSTELCVDYRSTDLRKKDPNVHARGVPRVSERSQNSFNISVMSNGKTDFSNKVKTV